MPRMTPAQCRAARAMLGWSGERLAFAADVSPSTIGRYETGIRVPRRRTFITIQATLEAAGVVFLESGKGVDQR